MNSKETKEYSSRVLHKTSNKRLKCAIIQSDNRTTVFLALDSYSWLDVARRAWSHPDLLKLLTLVGQGLVWLH